MSDINTWLPPLIPRSILFGNPTKESPQISPDGSQMAYLAPVDGVLNVWVGPIGTQEYRPITQDRDRGVRLYFWAFDNRHILYLQDVGGDENWRLYITSIDDESTRELTPYEGIQVQVLAYNKRFPNTMVLGLNRDNPAAHDAYHLKLTSGTLTKVADNPGNIVGWIADNDLNVRAAQAARTDGGFDLLVRDEPKGSWRVVITWTAEDGLNSSPLGFDDTGRCLYVIDARNANTGRLVKFDIATGTADVMAEDDVYDVSGTLDDPDTHEVLAVAFTKARCEWVALNGEVKDDFEQIAGTQPGDFGIYDRTQDNQTWLIGFTQDIGPIAYYRYDRATATAEFLFHNRPELERAQLASMQPVSFASRDSLTLHGYLTKPVNAPNEPLPMILLVHGGPWHRDTWGYDPEAQWLANRGYVVLQVNFRGSTGYGKSFLNAGNREWGGRMHDDLVDAVTWATTQGIADPSRVAIYGGSYGGYAALVGATFTPDLFCCAVDIVGPSNLITFIETIPEYWSAFLEVLHQRVGHPEHDRDFLIERSPLHRVDHIRIPMLIAQGANDPRVKQSESEQIVNAMQRQGIDHDYILFEDEGHGFAKPENRLTFYTAAEAFLAKYLGGRAET